jgi:hypothetical protein
MQCLSNLPSNRGCHLVLRSCGVVYQRLVGCAFLMEILSLFFSKQLTRTDGSDSR